MEEYPDVLLRKLSRRLQVLLANRERLRAGPLVRRLGGIRGEIDIERLATCAPIRLVYRPTRGGLHLDTVHLLNRIGLAEVARPGAAARQIRALEEARQATAALNHPQATAIAELLADESARHLDDRVIRALAALARLVEDGDIRPIRAFSVEVLGHSKALAAIRPQIERIVGPLERLGIRDTGALVLVGGNGHLYLAHSDVNVSLFRHIGIAASDVLDIHAVEVPAAGVLVVENLTAFHACLDQLHDLARPLVLWSGGFPGRGLIRLLEHAVRRGAAVRVWCDIDLGGVRIARLIHRATCGTARPVLMTSDLIADAVKTRPLSPEQRKAIQGDIARQPEGLLTETLRALLERSMWVEQEALLHRIPDLASGQGVVESR